MRINPNKLLCIASVLLALGICRDSRADLIVELTSAEIKPGGTAAIDVFVRSSDAAVDIGFYDLQFSITSIASTAGTSVRFISPQSESHLNSGEYVFSGVASGDPTTFVSGLANNTLSTTDFVDPDGNVPVTTPKLLARLDLSHHLPLGVDSRSLLGNSFKISVAAATFETFDGVVRTSDFSSESTIAVAVPEPNCFAWATLLGPVVLLRRVRNAARRN